MPRILTGGDSYPPGWLADSWERQRQDEQGMERAARMDPSHWGSLPLCPMCGRPLIAQPTCAACGDESEMAA
jgi:hypothetical protein